MRIILSKYSFLLVIMSFFCIIIIGTTALYFTKVIISNSLSLIDSLFIATSMVTGIGVLPINLSLFNSIGKTILMILMYTGNIGILIIILGLIFYFTSYTIEWYGITTELFTVISIKTISSLFKIILFTSLAVLFFGTTSYYLLSKYLLINISLFNCVFLSVNFFCNVGVSIKDILPEAFLQNSIYFLISSIIIIAGSIGFLFLFELREYYKNKQSSSQYYFSLTSQLMIKIYSLTTLFFWLFYFLAFEKQFNLLTIFRSLFAAISLRSCGISPYTLSSDTIAFLSSLYGLCGGGVLGTSSGIKTTLLGIIIYTFFSLIKKKDVVTIANKKISWQLISFAHIFIFYLIQLIIIATIIVNSLLEHPTSCIQLFSNMVSLVGSGLQSNDLLLTIGIYEKTVCISLIIIAKVMSFSINLYLSKLKQNNIVYPEGKLIII